MTIGYAPSWTFGSDLEIVGFLTIIAKYPHLTSFGCYSIIVSFWNIYIHNSVGHFLTCKYVDFQMLDVELFQLYGEIMQ
jgi:hypothetical protein